MVIGVLPGHNGRIGHHDHTHFISVADPDTGRLVWAAAGRDRKTVEAFLDALGQERYKQLESVSADMAAWVAGPVRERCPNAELCLHPFHIVALAPDALDEIRREVWNEARQAGRTVLAKGLNGARSRCGRTPSACRGGMPPAHGLPGLARSRRWPVA